MNVTDYNQQMSNLRSEFRDRFNKARKENEKVFDNLRETHENKQKRQSEIFGKEKGHLEEQNKQNAKEYDRKSREAIEEKKENYYKNLNELREDFREVRLKEREDTNRKLADIRKSYNDSLDSIDNQNKLKLTDLENFREMQLDKKYRNYQDVIEKLQENLENRFDDLNTRFRQDQEKLVYDQNKLIKNLEKKSMDESKKLKKKMIEEKENLTRIQGDKIKYLNERIDQLKNKKNDQSSKTTMEIAEKLENLEEQNKSALIDQREFYNKELKGINLENSEEKRKLLKRHSESLGDLKENYRISKETEKTRHLDTEKHNQERYQQQTKQLSDRFENNLGNFIEDANDRFKKFQENNNDDKRKLISDYEREKNKIVLDGNLARNKLNTEHQKENQKLRDSHDDRIKELKNYQNSILTEINDQKKKEKELMQKNFLDLNDELSRKSSRDQEIRQRDFIDGRNRMERKFSEDLKNVKRDFHRRFEGRGGRIEQAKEKERNLLLAHERQVENFKKKIDDLEYQSAQTRDKTIESHKEQLNDERDFTLKKLQAKDDQMVNLQENVFKKSKERDQKIIDLYKLELKNNQVKNSENAVSQRNLRNELLERNRVHYGNIVKRINEDNVSQISEIQDDYAKTKTEYIENVRKEAFKDRQDLKENLQTVMERKSSSFELKLKKANEDKEKTIENYEKKITNIEKNVQDRIEKRIRLENERREADLKDFKTEIASLNYQKEKEFNELKNRYEKKIYNLKTQNDMIVDNLVGGYEKQLAMERENIRRDLGADLRRSEDSLKRQYAQFQLERDSLIQKYEMQIDKLHQKIQMINARKNA